MSEKYLYTICSRLAERLDRNSNLTKNLVCEKLDKVFEIETPLDGAVMAPESAAKIRTFFIWFRLELDRILSELERIFECFEREEMFLETDISVILSLGIQISSFIQLLENYKQVSLNGLNRELSLEYLSFLKHLYQLKIGKDEILGLAAVLESIQCPDDFQD